MEQTLINLVTGALGGVAVGKSSPTFDLGMIGNIISGLIGGGVLGQIVTLLLPAITAAAQSGNLSVEGIISQVIAGGAGGAILTAIVGAIKNKAAAWRAAASPFQVIAAAECRLCLLVRFRAEADMPQPPAASGSGANDP